MRSFLLKPLFDSPADAARAADDCRAQFPLVRDTKVEDGPGRKKGGPTWRVRVFTEAPFCGTAAQIKKL